MIFETLKIKDLKIGIGKLVKMLRKQNNLTQNDLAKALDLSRLTIQNLEAGKNYTIDTLLKILQHFDLIHSLNEEITQYMAANENIKSLY